MKFTVVIPSFNQSAWLETCLRSVLGQAGVKLEVIVMDGGSTDGSCAIIERYAHQLAHWESGPDEGQAAAIRSGFERATGDILAWLNSDDLYLPGALARVKRFFEQNADEEVVNGGAFYIDGAGDPLRLFRVRENHTLGVAASHRRFLYGTPQQGIWQMATFWRRSAYEAVGGIDPQFRYIMDLDLFTRLASRRRFAALHELLACFRMHDTNKSHTLLELYRRELQIWAAKYGMDSVPTWKKSLLHTWYRIPNAGRRVIGLVRERSGLLRLDAPRW